MPVNKKYPLEQLLAACADYRKTKGRMISIEYVLIDGVNDSVAMVASFDACATVSRLEVEVPDGRTSG